MEFNYKNYHIRMLDKNNKQELIEVQKLRYDYLLKEFNNELPEDGLDDDGYDKYCESIIIIDKEKGKIVGTYRLATLKTIGDAKFKTEGEFNCDAIRNCGKDSIELGRAVVHADYRNGIIIQLLWAAIFEYAYENDCKYLFGTCSFHGVDPSKYGNLLCYLKKNYLTDLDIYATHNVYEFDYLDEYDEAKVKEEIAGVIKSYLSFDCKFARNGYIDYEFNSCDVLTVVDMDNCNQRILQRMKRFVQ
ncbi:MAG: GNAT family N-acetyltransferase [Bacilli bacterium]|nr:GNAT family N-acetyltransferase [Bacilli bacterium]